MPGSLVPEEPRNASLRIAGECLGRGDLIGFRTDTLYGISCDPANTFALGKLGLLKARPDGRGFVSLCRDFQTALDWSGRVDARVVALMDAVWPGRVTLILPAGPGIPATVMASDSSWAVRVPDRAWCLDLLRGQFPWLPSTSANRKGMAPGATASLVREALGEEVSLIVDAGEIPEETSASALVDVRAFPARILRPGDPGVMARVAAGLSGELS